VDRTAGAGRIEIRVTSVERTVVDVLDRLDLAGGIEEVWRSLQSVPALDLESLEHYVAVLGSSLLTAKIGFYLESRREELAVPGRLLDRLRGRIPKAPTYRNGSPTPGTARRPLGAHRARRVARR
jgi:predicted transcriptional regulator of viral defense system